MKTAIDCYARGKQREANADDYTRSRIYPQGRFICPECGELVHLAGSKYANHFSHYKKTDVSVLCDRRVDGVSIQSIYERMGLPLYLRKDVNGDFRLFMGFRPLPVEVIELAGKNRVSFTIRETGNKFRITCERFSDVETTLIPILNIPYGQEKFRLKYEPLNNSTNILKYWSDEAEGFLYDGALFSVSELGGKKIRSGDTISSDTEYYWVRMNYSLPREIPGIKMKRVGNLILKNGKCEVFQGVFDSSISDSEFSILTTYLRQSLKVHLLEKQPEFIPVWPPCLKTENGYIVRNTNKWMYGRVESGNEEPKIYVHYEDETTPQQLYANDSIARVLINSINTYISIDRKYVSGGVNILKHEMQVDERRIYLELNQEIKTRGYECIELERKEDCVEIKLPYEFDYIYLNRKRKITYKKCIREIMLDDIANQDLLIITSNQTVYFLFEFRVPNDTDLNDRISDEELMKSIQFYINTKKVKIPYKYLVKLRNEYEDSVEIMKMLKHDEIPVPVLKMLGEL